MIPTLDPYRATQGRQSKHKGQRKGDKANTRGNARETKQTQGETQGGQFAGSTVEYRAPRPPNQLGEWSFATRLNTPQNFSPKVGPWGEQQKRRGGDPCARGLIMRARKILGRGLSEICRLRAFPGYLGGSERCARSPYPTYAGDLIILLPTVVYIV